MKYFNLLLFLTFALFSQAATISSKSSGGNWNATSTWIGNSIPTSADDVTINGTVSGGGTCNNLTVSNSATLQNRSGYGETLVINGNIINNGTIQNSASGYLGLNLFGTVTNNGVWKNSYVYLYQNGNAYLTQASGKYFENLTLDARNGKADSIIMQSNVQFKNCTYASIGTNKRVFVANSNRLDFISCSVANYDIQTNGTLHFDATIVTGCTIYGSGTITGVVDLKSGTTIQGTITNKGTLRNASGYGVAVHFKGSLTNEGIITNSNSGSLEVFMDDNFVNKGIYSPLYTQFKSGNSHTISQTSGKFFTGRFYSFGTDSVLLGSNVTFRKAIFTGNSSSNVINAKNFTLDFDSSTIETMVILSKDTVHLNASIVSNTLLSGNMSITGAFRLHGSSQLTGTITNFGTIHNNNGYGVTTKISGRFINHGNISKHPLGGGFYLQLDADIENYGYYDPNTSLLLGKSLRTFQQNDTSAFQGRFETEDTSGGILLGSDVTFRNAYISWTNIAPYSSFVTNGYRLTLNDCEVRQVHFVSKDTIDLDGSFLTNIRTTNTPYLTGNMLFHNNIEFGYGFINLDTIYQSPGYGVTTHVYGKLTNKGLIAKQSGSFTIYIHDAIHNEGIYGPLNTYFAGTEPIEISQSVNAAYTGNFYASDTSNGIKLASNVTLSKIYYDGTSVLPYASFNTMGHNLTFDSSNIIDVRIIGSDTINGHGSAFTNMHTYGMPVFTGDVTLHYGVYFKEGCVNQGILQNASGYGRTVKLAGRFVNNGIVRANPNGGTLEFNLFGDIHNAGTYKPNYTYTSGGIPRRFSQEANKPFEGKYYASDTADGIILGSDVTFKKVEINWHDSKPYSTIQTNKFRLKIDSSYIHEVIIKGNDTLDLNGSSLYQTEFSGEPVTQGIMEMNSGVIFHSSLTNLGTIQNSSGYGITTFFNGDIRNNGYIKTNSNGGIFTLATSGNITNNTFIEVNYLDLLGNNARTIAGANIKALTGSCTIRDSMTLRGENYLPNINITSPNILTIDTSSSLICNAINSGALSRIKNYGSVSSTKESSSWQEIKYLDASLTYHNVDITDLLIETYGAQQHPSTEGAVNSWWRLKPTPQDVTDSLKLLKLKYKVADLNNNLPNDLRVYFTPNAGLSWRKITENVVVDVASETVQIPDAPAYGHYVLSSKDLGILAFKPIIQRAEPKVFGNKGNVTVYGFGIGLTQDMTVTLKKSGSQDIVADSVYLTDRVGESFIAIFNVDVADIGTYSVHIDIPGEAPLELADYFTVEKADRPDPWVMLSGRDRFLINRWQTFKINYGNLSNVDAEGVPLFFVIKDIAGLGVKFPDVQIGIPKSFTDDG